MEEKGSMLWEQKKEKLVNRLEELAAGDECLAF